MFLLPGNAVNRVAPLNRGLVGWWMVLPNRLGGGGNTFRDLMGRNHGTLTNGPTWSGFKPNGAFGSISFDGSNDSVNIPASACITGAGARTWFCRFYITTYSGTDWSVLMTCGSAASASAWELLVGGGGQYCIAHWFGGNTTNAGVVSTGVWHSAAITYDGTNARSYLNGTLLATNSIALTTSSSEVKFGSEGSFAPTFSVPTGYISDARIYNVALSGSRVAALHKSSLLGYQNELNWQRYPVFGTEQAAATFNPAWAINSNAYIHLGA